MVALCKGEVVKVPATAKLPFRLQATSVYLPVKSPRAAVVQLLVVALKELLASPVRSPLKDLLAPLLLAMAGAKLVKWPIFNIVTLFLAMAAHRFMLLALARYRRAVVIGSTRTFVIKFTSKYRYKSMSRMCCPTTKLFLQQSYPQLKIRRQKCAVSPLTEGLSG